MSRRRKAVSTHVELTSGSRRLVIRAVDSLKAVEATAKRLWPLTRVGPSTEQADHGGEPIGFVSATGSVSDPAVQDLTPPEIATPTHLIPLQESPDDRHI